MYFYLWIRLYSLLFIFCFFFSSRSRHTSGALVTGFQTCALPICELLSDRIKVPTPVGAEPEDVLAAVTQVLDELGVADDDSVSLGVAFPAIIKNGRTMSAANVSEKWIGFEAERFFEDGLGRDIHFANDADVAGIAEVRYGAAKGVDGLVILTTLGTGIGSAMIYDGVLIT